MQNRRPDILLLPPVIRNNIESDIPLVSVITPNFNHLHYLQDTIIGVNRQSYQNLEHIIVDGASNDGTKELLENTPEITWISEPDKGVLDAFLKGVRLSTGKYLMICPSSDMYIDPNWIKYCVETLESQPNISLVLGGVGTANQSGELIEARSWPTKDARVPNEIEMFFHWLKIIFHIMVQKLKFLRLGAV